MILYKSEPKVFLYLHTCWFFWNKLQKLEGIKQMPHPAYIPDLAPLDYYLFQPEAHLLCLPCFHNQEVEASAKEFFTQITRISMGSNNR